MSSKNVSWTIDINIYSTNTTNTTQNSPQPVGWTSLNLFGLLVNIIGAILNFSLLVVFIKHRSLRTSFGVYLINLLLFEAVLIWVHSPIHLISNYIGDWPFDYNLCWFVNFVGDESLIIFAHFLITLNRVWAVTFPFSYRTRHTTKFAIILCGSVATVWHLVYIPVTIGTVVLEPDSATNGYSCKVDTAVPLYLFSVLGLFIIPAILVILSYPYVCYKSFFSDRRQRIAPQVKPSIAQGHHEMTHHSATVGTGNVQGIPKTKLCGCRRKLRGSATGFLTLTLMTLSVVVCLMPKESLDTYLITVRSAVEPPGLMAVFDALQHLTTVFDPVLIAVGNTEIRTMLLEQFRFGRR